MVDRKCSCLAQSSSQYLVRRSMRKSSTWRRLSWCNCSHQLDWKGGRHNWLFLSVLYENSCKLHIMESWICLKPRGHLFFSAFFFLQILKDSKNVGIPEIPNSLNFHRKLHEKMQSVYRKVFDRYLHFLVVFTEMLISCEMKLPLFSDLLFNP
jgi:hypothetical protein